MRMCVYSVRQPGKASTEIGAPLYPSPPALSPVARTYGTSLRRCSTGALRDSKQHRPPPPGFNKQQKRCDKNRDMDNRGPALCSTPHPALELPVPGLASLVTSPGPCCRFLVGVHYNLARHRQVKLSELLHRLESWRPCTRCSQERFQLNSHCVQYQHRSLPRGIFLPGTTSHRRLGPLSATPCHALLCNLDCGVAGGMLNRYVSPSIWVLSISVIYWRRAR